MSDKQKTAVEWLVENTLLEGIQHIWIKEIEQAKEMEKQQIINAYLEGYCKTADNSQDYYEKTYKHD